MRRFGSSIMVSHGRGRSCALVLLVTLLSAVLVTEVRARSALLRQDQPGGGLIDTRFWQGVLNKTLEGNLEQAFNLVFGRMSDDISGAMSKLRDTPFDVKESGICAYAVEFI
ncbi:hypothetical protein HPB49_013420 [Dermacentor silvarum]|uniref:Uncharacterized protein n=1 Tax=Dermacentor silvarum TaxID=543639 RepID=A0ACB8CL78_DERSI|nr:hypothetical protein HPB49_013420 [Dermacentor silvarum]